MTRTRELIEQSLYELLMEKSLQELTIGDITDRARINRSTFYAHFEDKYDLYRHMVRNTFEQILVKSLEGQENDQEGQLRAIVHSACLFFQELNATCPPADRQTRPLVEVEVQQQIYESILCWLQAQTDVQREALATPEAITKMVSWAIWGAALDWEGKQHSLDALAEQIYTVVVKMVYVENYS